MVSFEARNRQITAVMKNIIAAFLCFAVVLVLGEVSVLSDIGNVEEFEPFRMQKVNIIWQKAKELSHLSKERLNALFVDLKRQDKDERKWKHQKSQGLDKGGDMEAVLRQNLARIMGRYGMGGRDAGEASPNLSDGDKLYEMESNRIKKSAHIKDERLDRLWQAAIDEAQFDKHELEELRKELDHHHEKWQQYNDLIGLVSKHEDKHENAIGENPDSETLRKLREEMNIKRKDINSNYHRLKVKVFKGPDDNLEFKDHRVRDLWKQAKTQNLSEEELEVFKEELKHFDHKISKHDDFQEQLDVAEVLLSQGYDHIKQKHEKLSSKVKEHKRYIKKLHTTLEEKIGPRNEL